MQALVATARRGGVPDDHVVRPVSRRNPGRTPAVLTHIPGKRNRGRICCGNSIRPNRASIVVKANVRSLTGVISDSGCSSVDPADIRQSHR